MNDHLKRKGKRMKIDKRVFYFALMVLAIVALVIQEVRIERLEEQITTMHAEHDSTIQHCDSLLQDAYERINK